MGRGRVSTVPDTFSEPRAYSSCFTNAFLTVGFRGRFCWVELFCAALRGAGVDVSVVPNCVTDAEVETDGVAGLAGFDSKYFLMLELDLGAFCDPFFPLAVDARGFLGVAIGRGASGVDLVDKVASSPS